MVVAVVIVVIHWQRRIVDGAIGCSECLVICERQQDGWCSSRVCIYTTKIWRVQEDVTVDRRADSRWI
jgi:hypothetical protein